MAVEYSRMQQRGGTESELLASAEVPLVREIIAASDTGRTWVGDGLRSLAELPSVIAVPPGQSYLIVDKATNLPIDQGILDAFDGRFAAAGSGGGGGGDVTPRVDYRLYDATKAAYPPAGNAPADTLLQWIGPVAPPINGLYARQPSVWFRTS
jgi:hypothetical protein